MQLSLENVFLFLLPASCFITTSFESCSVIVKPSVLFFNALACTILFALGSTKPNIPRIKALFTIISFVGNSPSTAAPTPVRAAHLEEATVNLLIGTVRFAIFKKGNAAGATDSYGCCEKMEVVVPLRRTKQLSKSQN